MRQPNPASKKVRSPLESTTGFFRDLGTKARKRFETGDVDEDTLDKFGELMEVGPRIEQAKQSYLQGETEADVSQEEFSKAVEHLSRHQNPNTQRAFYKIGAMEEPGSPNNPGTTIEGLKPKGRARQIEDTIEAAEYLNRNASDTEIVEALVDYANGTSLEVDSKPEGYGGLQSGGSYSTEAERALDIIDQFENDEIGDEEWEVWRKREYN